ncbi:hypothetical protein ACLX1H_005522 [Fusarium chlamydosporum]
MSQTSSREQEAFKRVYQIQRQRQFVDLQRQQQANQVQSQTGNTMNQNGNQMRSQQMGQQMGRNYDDLPVQEIGDIDIINEQEVSPEFISFLSACQNGDISTVESIVTSQPRTPIFLHRGLVNAMRRGNVDITRYLLQSGAPISRSDPRSIILSSPASQQMALFEALTEHGWNVNTPGYYGEVILPMLIQFDKGDLIDWFLAHGADPNLGVQRDNRDRMGESETDSCQALELAASKGTVDLVQKLLDAGAKITNGAPLYCAAGACPPGGNPHVTVVTPTMDFDISRIPVMKLLVENGAGVNDKLQSRYVTSMYPIVNAVMAGAVERVKWLLDQGADPDLKGAYGSAKDYASKLSN